MRGVSAYVSRTTTAITSTAPIVQTRENLDSGTPVALLQWLNRSVSSRIGRLNLISRSNKPRFWLNGAELHRLPSSGYALEHVGKTCQ